MRASVAFAQQTLTAEAATVLKHAVSDAQRRGHTQITPLHVASSLLTISGSVLRQACLQSHRHMPHPLQCRALELCFNVALERLPTVQAASSHVAPAPPQPSFSNALVAALKRAQAHQRRGCPEQQQVPLLAVKVEMEQLIISILDDPSVSRVMREAGFSSTHVKNSLEEALGSSSLHPTSNVDLSHLKFNYAEAIAMKLGGVASFAKHANPFQSTEMGGFPSAAFLVPIYPSEAQHRSSISASLLGRSLEVNLAGSREQFVRDVVEVLLRQHKRNPLIVGEPEMATGGVVKELLEHLERGDVDLKLKGVKLISPQLCNQSKEEMEQELLHLRRVVDQNISSGVIVFLGDVQWLVDRNALAQQAAGELGRLISLYGGCGRFWLMGTSTSQTYFRSQARNPSLEVEWGFQPVRISIGSTLRTFPRFERPAAEDNKPEASEVCVRHDWPPQAAAKPPMNLLRLFDDSDPDELRCCPECISNYGNECSLLREQELSAQRASAHSSSSPANIFTEKQLCAEPANLSTWLQFKPDTCDPAPAMAPQKSEGQSFAQKLRSLRVKWNGICHAQHKELLKNSLPGNMIVVPESASSSSQHSGGKTPKGRLRSESPTCVSVDASGVSLGTLMNKNCSKLSIATEPSWLTLQPRPTSEAVMDSAGDHSNVLDLRDLAVFPGSSPVCTRNSERSMSQRQDLSYSYTGERHDQQDSELTVQTDLALGRSVDQAKGSTESVSTALLGGKVSNLCKPLTIKNSRIATGAVQMPMCSWKDRLIRPVSLYTDTRPSNDPLAGLMQSSSPLRVMKQADLDGVKDLQVKLEARVPWQKEAIRAIATAVVKCRAGLGKKRGTSSKRDTWLLLLGSDRVGKRTMAKALAESVFGCQKKLFRLSFRQEISGGQQYSLRVDAEDSHGDEIRVSTRGKTTSDRVAEAVRSNPFSVVLLEDIDQADNVTRNVLMRAMEKGRILESNGREVSLSNVIFIMTSSAGGIHSPRHRDSTLKFSEDRLLTSLGHGMRVSLEKEASKAMPVLISTHISVVDFACSDPSSQVVSSDQPSPLSACCKRKANSGLEAACDPQWKKTKENPTGRLLELDLNLPISEELIPASSPHVLTASENLSNCENDRPGLHYLIRDISHLSDSVVSFQPFKFDEISGTVIDLLDRTASAAVTVSRPHVEIDIAIIEHLVAAVWEGLCDKAGLENWADEVLKPTISSIFHTTNSTLSSAAGIAVRLISEKSPLSRDCFTISGLPRTISIGSSSL